MHFQHSPELRSDFPHLVAGVVHASGIDAKPDVDEKISTWTTIARARLAGGPESEFPEIQAWRRAFARMGLKPTQYRCASESLLRRYRRDQVLPRVHPLVDVCNALSLAYGIPVAALDTAKISGDLEVRRATGAESYLTFSGETERPAPGEVIFADEGGNAHARRWTNRQSGLSAVREATAGVLIVAEALHDRAAEDIPSLTAAIAEELGDLWPVSPTTAVLTRTSPGFEFEP